MSPPEPSPTLAPWRRTALAYGCSVLMVAVCTGIARLMFPLFELANLAMVYLLGVVVISAWFGRGPSVFTTVAGVAAFDYFYVPPYYDLFNSELRYSIMFVIMLVVGVVTATLTERVRKREHDAEHAKMLVEIERQRNALLSMVSHDLRTPLATIIGAATTILEDSNGVDIKVRGELLRSIHEEATRLNRLVTNLLELTKIESGTLRLQREWHVLEEVVGSAMARIDRTLSDRRVSISIPVDTPLVAVDALLIEQVLINLLENAAKYTPVESEIELCARVEGASVAIEVRDRGPGLPPGDESRVFDKFHRARGAQRWGSGLGLTICKGIVEIHGGTIAATNRSGGGALFRFTLPVSEGPPSVPFEAQPMSSPGRDSPVAGATEVDDTRALP